MTNDIRASYTDTFAHAFDAKGRITVPAEWREPSFEPRLFCFPSKENCVKVYPESWLSRLQGQIATLRTGDPMRGRIEDLAAMAQSTTWDQQGRISVKEKLRQGAALKKEAVLVGRLDHFQIWDQEAWNARQVVPTNIEEALGSIGL